jgi:hypothetical protein
VANPTFPDAFVVDAAGCEKRSKGGGGPGSFGKS